MEKYDAAKPVVWGLIAAFSLVLAYFTVISLISGFLFTENQFFKFWYYYAFLALGFGIQIGLYSYLKQTVRGRANGKAVVVTTGATSTAAMVSCCAHYLANILPLVGISAFASFIGEYQTRLFWAAIALNLAGIAYVLNKIVKINKNKKQTT